MEIIVSNSNSLKVIEFESVYITSYVQVLV